MVKQKQETLFLLSFIAVLFEICLPDAKPCHPNERVLGAKAKR